MTEQVKGRIWVESHYKGKETSREAEMEVRTFKTTPAVVSVKLGMTFNLGDYESARVDAGVTLPCYPEEVEDAYRHAWELVAAEVDVQAEPIREMQAQRQNKRR